MTRNWEDSVPDCERSNIVHFTGVKKKGKRKEGREGQHDIHPLMNIKNDSRLFDTGNDTTFEDRRLV